MSIKDRKEREKAKRRADIIDAAEHLFFSKGYDAVTMEDIAKRLDLNKATIYLYFNNKESLFFEIVLRAVKMLDEVVMRTVEGKDGGVDILNGFWDGYFDFVKKNPDHFRAFMYFKSQRFGLENAVRVDTQFVTPFSSTIVNIPNGECIVSILDAYMMLFDLLTKAIRKGIEDRTFRQDLDPKETALIVLMMVENLANLNPVFRYELDSAMLIGSRFQNEARPYLFRMLVQ
jgi:TetR/AcrR family transcriptional regulator